MESKQLHVCNSGYPHESDRPPGQPIFLELYGIKSRFCIPAVGSLYEMGVHMCHDESVWIFLHKETCCIGHISSLTNHLLPPSSVSRGSYSDTHFPRRRISMICPAVLRLFTSSLSGRAFKERPSQGNVGKVKQIDKDKES